jgi:putative endonuclease
LALAHLLGQGYELVERNYRTRRGEVDLILRQGATLVFVEVKLRRGSGFGDPLEAVTPRKRQKIRAVAEEYLAGEDGALPEGVEEVRFDAVGVSLGRGEPRLRHVEDAF